MGKVLVSVRKRLDCIHGLSHVLIAIEVMIYIYIYIDTLFYVRIAYDCKSNL